MKLVLTIAAGVALGIIFARVALYCGARWGAPALVVSFKFIGRNRRKLLSVLMLAMSIVLAPLLALYRAEQEMYDLKINRHWTENSTERLAADRSIPVAAFRRVNLVVKGITSLAEDHRYGSLDEDHDPFERIKGTVYSNRFGSHFFGSRNGKHTQAIIDQLEWGILSDERALRGGGSAVLRALFVAALLDLPTLVIVAMGFGGVRLIRDRARLST